MKKALIGLLSVALFPGLQAADAPTVASVKKLGGLVLPWPGEEGAWEVEFHLRGRDLTDEGLASVAALKKVVALNLRDTKITSAGLAHLKGLTSLKRLHLERTKVDDAGIASLMSLSQLEYLNLYGTGISDKALEQLSELKNLQKLYVWQTKVTDEGVAKFKKARPKVKIVQGVDLSKIVVVKKVEEVPDGELKWMAVKPDFKPKKSRPGSFIIIHFENKSGVPVKLYWVDYGGGLKQYGDIAPGATKRQTTYSDAVWLVKDAKDVSKGYFVTSTKNAKAIIPKLK